MTVSFATQFGTDSDSVTLPNPAVSNGNPIPATAVGQDAQAIDEGVDFFAVQGELDGKRMEGCE